MEEQWEILVKPNYQECFQEMIANSNKLGACKVVSANELTEMLANAFVKKTPDRRLLLTL